MKRGGYYLGRRREHSLRAKLMREGWFSVRCYKSAGGLPKSKVKPVDVIALKRGKRPLLIQASKSLSGITDEEKRELRRVAQMAGALPILAFIHKGRWRMEEA